MRLEEDRRDLRASIPEVCFLTSSSSMLLVNTLLSLSSSLLDDLISGTGSPRLGRWRTDELVAGAPNDLVGSMLGRIRFRD